MVAYVARTCTCISILLLKNADLYVSDQFHLMSSIPNYATSSVGRQVVKDKLRLQYTKSVTNECNFKVQKGLKL